MSFIDAVLYFERPQGGDTAALFSCYMPDQINLWAETHGHGAFQRFDNFNAVSFLISFLSFKEPKVFLYFTIFGKYHFFYVGYWGGILHVLGEILLLILFLLPPPFAIESCLSGTEQTQGLCQMLLDSAQVPGQEGQILLKPLWEQRQNQPHVSSQSPAQALHLGGGMQIINSFLIKLQFCLTTVQQVHKQDLNF